MNPVSREQKQALVKHLNEALISPSVGAWATVAVVVKCGASDEWNFTEVVISPPSIYLIPLAESLRKDVKVAAQNCYVKANGAFTGEIR